MDRRVFLGTLTGGLLAAPLAVGAQQAAKVHRIGYLTVPSRATAQGVADKFQHGLRDLGWIDGQNIVVNYRFADSNVNRLPDLAAELVRFRADVIVAGANAAVIAAKNAARTTPIVMFLTIDPVDAAWWRASLGQAGTSRGSPSLPGQRSTGSNCSCSRTPSHAPLGSPFC